MTDIDQARIEAEQVIRATQKALKKHIGLIKKREHIPSIVAMIERLRADMRGKDAALIYEHINILNQLTRGFAGHVLKSSVRRAKK